MPNGDHTTLTAVAAPTVIAIGCPPELNDRCARALAPTGVSFKHCEVSNAATFVAERRPLVIVLVDDLYAFDPREFDALARDLRASLLRVEEDIAPAKLELLLGAAIDAAIERLRQASAGRPTAPADEAPPPSWTGIRRRRARSRAERDDEPVSSRGRRP